MKIATVTVSFQEMVKLCYDTGAKLQIMNRRNLTPLTLAAHLAKKEVKLNFLLNFTRS